MANRLKPEVVRRIADRETHVCPECGDSFSGLLQAETHLTVEHGIGRDDAREQLVRHKRSAISIGPFRFLVAGFVGVFLISGCATTLTHPVSGQTATCQSGYALGGGVGLAGVVMGGLSLMASLALLAEQQDCVSKLKARGYEDVRPMTTAPTSAVKPQEHGG